MAKRWRLPDGKRRRNPDGKRSRSDDPCCCCDCEADGPTAGFSYERIDADPCTFNFTDESTAGACGAIVSGDWKVDGEVFSTLTNPTNVVFDGSGPWTVRRTVTDAAGCQDFIEHEVICCDCEADGPTADFSYEQTDDSPCTFDFTDDSVAGACGAIVAWAWDFGDGNTSTAQNPSHTYAGSGPWTVTLTVTDAFGCEDAAAGAVNCYHLGCCDDGVPDTVTVVISGVTNAGCAPGSCLPFNGSHTLNYVGTFSGECEYVKALGEDCTGFGQTAIRALIKSASVRVILDTRYPGGGGDQHLYSKTPAGGICQGTHTINYTSGGPTSCNAPASVQLTI